MTTVEQSLNTALEEHFVLSHWQAWSLTTGTDTGSIRGSRKISREHRNLTHAPMRPKEPPSLCQLIVDRHKIASRDISSAKYRMGCARGASARAPTASTVPYHVGARDVAAFHIRLRFTHFSLSSKDGPRALDAGTGHDSRGDWKSWPGSRAAMNMG